MEVVSPSSPNGSPTFTINHFDFNFKPSTISPYLSAPSSPKRFGQNYYLSAPATPSRFYSQFDYYLNNVADDVHIEDNDDDEHGGFAFSVHRESDSSPRSAEELFHGGKIKPLETPKSPLLSPNRPTKSPIAKGKKAIIETFFRTKKNKEPSFVEERRGRDRTPTSEISSSNSNRRITRSHSPYRTSHYTFEGQQQSNNKEDSVPTSSSKSSSRIWRLRDFLLFRSASEGRGSNKDPFRKYPVSYKKSEEGKGSSIRNTENPKLSRRKETVSAHELLYARKKAESEDLKKRTFLPYKQGILGRLAGLGSR
ncbi:uncharacterized protein [Cicer arietinum]|uniref:Melanoma-associated antigen C1-like n=1 Tax=Cicer arietinum TaxID=3827 RepID=A0A1S2YAV1_CICAR|nr:melanoma-associated antigen C1-like [Cicer arietinum]